MPDKKSFKDELFDLLSDFKKVEVENFYYYFRKILLDKNKDGSLKNPWAESYKPEHLAKIFKDVNNEGLVFDGIHVTLQSTGVTFDYVAYKNKMLIAYPETTISQGVVYDGDDHSFSEKDGKVFYHHKHKDPFDRNENKIKGLYIVIRNKRGEFLTLMTKSEIDKHKKSAKTQYIWNGWYVEMAKKTIIKKACKFHFDDIVSGIETIDNENYDPDLVNESDIEKRINQATSLDELSVIVRAGGLNPLELKAISEKKKELRNDNS